MWLGATTGYSQSCLWVTGRKEKRKCVSRTQTCLLQTMARTHLSPFPDVEPEPGIAHFPGLEARGVRQILVPHRRLSLWSLEGDSVRVACLLHVMCSLLHVMLVSQPLFYILVGVWSCGIWMNALSQQQWAGSMFKHWTSFTDPVILLSYAPSECSRLSLLELNSNSAKVLIARPAMRIHNDAGRTGRYRWAWEQESGVVGGVCTSVFI